MPAHRTSLIWIAGLFLGLWLGLPQFAGAVGTEFNFSGSDLQIAVNSRWAGCHEGGYYPIRIQTRNLGPQRVITYEFRTMNSGGGTVPTVSREVSIEQNATVQTTLLIPMVSFGTYGDLRVLEGGHVIKGMSKALSLPDINNGETRLTSMLIISSTPVDSQLFSQSVTNTTAHATSSYSPYGGGYSPYSSGSTENTETVSPSQLPTTWLAYSGLDIVAVPWDVLDNKISPEARQAILQWVQSGGKLLVYEVGSQLPALDSLLGWDQRAYRGERWRSAIPTRYRVIHIADPADASRTAPESISAEAAWKITPGTFAIRSLGLGEVVRMPENPFPGSVSHWSWLTGQFENETLSWSRRNGINARTGNSTFLQFLIPGVGGVPVFSFLVLITLFTFVIGPLNYGYFLRKKRLSMLLVTVPVLAIGSSLLLLGYSTIANGISTKSRIRSLTIIDQKQNSSLSISRVAYYSGMAPSGGLTFSPTTAVYPIWPTEDSFEMGRVNWSDSQHFQSGWLKSRTRTQFLVVNQREQRGRLEVKTAGDKPQVSNGLEWTLGMLMVKDAQGKLWSAENVRPGAVVDLIPADAPVRTRFRAELTKQEIGLPDGLTQDQAERIVTSANPYRYYNYSNVYQDHYRNSQQERLIRQMQLTTESDQQAMAANSYYALLEKSPGLDVGLSGTSERASEHLLIGYLD